jgi:bifunctional N-acetylglucosamine-1-phosphate-uridyltransferase/glucosamine-1-phosphate-acetyltransferase GlmU-like protein
MQRKTAHTQSSAKTTSPNRRKTAVMTCRAKLPAPYGKLCRSDEHVPVAITTECHCQENKLKIVAING